MDLAMRYLTPEISRFLAEEKKMAFVASPRQVGKTTLAKHLLSLDASDAFYFNWDIQSHRKAIIFSVIEDPGSRFENLVALHLRKLCDAWTDWGYGDFALQYVRDREKREVDFLITENRRPHTMVEAKLTEGGIDPNLKYFHDRLKPAYSVQLVRTPGKNKGRFASGGVFSVHPTNAYFAK